MKEIELKLYDMSENILNNRQSEKESITDNENQNQEDESENENEKTTLTHQKLAIHSKKKEFKNSNMLVTVTTISEMNENDI